jgi:hypothetical protein
MSRANHPGIWAVAVSVLTWLAAANVYAEDPGDALLRPFLDRIEAQDDEAARPLSDADGMEVPGDFHPWWERPVSDSILPSQEHVPVDLDALILSSLVYSAHVHWLSDARLIAQADVSRAGAAFDWSAFVESKYIDTSEPVGSLLTTGGSPRFRDNHWTAGGGFRRRTAAGGQFEMAQRIGYQNNNSVYFVPTQQGTGTFALSFAQPLLRGAGRDYNTRTIVLAQIDARTADEEYVKRVQNHLLELTRAYWQLYLSRAVVLQKRNLYEEARRIYRELESRREVDATLPQILQAKGNFRLYIGLHHLFFRVLENHAHIHSQLPAVHCSDILPFKENPAADPAPVKIRDQSRQYPGQGGLARTGTTGHQDKFSFLDF